MGYSAITTPDTYMAAYSAVPIKVYSTEWNTQENFKYIINLCWDTITISSITTASYGNNAYTQLTVASSIDYKIGDSVFLEDVLNSNQFTGYFNVQAIPNSTTILIDLITGLQTNTSGNKLSKVVKWKLNPDPDGYGKLDLSNVLKDKVSDVLTGQSVNYGLAYNGDDTRFCYTLFCGSEKNYVFEFEDNLFSGGSVGFYNSSIVSLSGVPFQVGDLITITQDQVGWPYTDNFFSSGSVGFTGSTQHSFLAGQTITVTGQETNPYYNGITTILSASTYDLITNKAFQGSSPVEPGIIYGIPRPEYNATALITEIFTSVTYGVVIITNIPYTTSSVVIPGSIQFANGVITTTPNEIEITGSCVFNAHINRPDYSLTAYDPYVIQNRSYSGNNISTLLNNTNYYRVENNTIGFLLGHTYLDSYVDGMVYDFYDSNNTSLGRIKLLKDDSRDIDFYFPFGLNQLSQSPYVDISGTFSTYSGSVNSYSLFLYDGGTYTQRTNIINFKINPDCSMYEIFHLMWKDRYGSYISYPFIYMSRKNIESDRKTYYKQEGNWNDDTFQYYDYDRGETNFYTQSKNSYVVNSGWLYQFETTLMEDLMQSTDVYLQTPDNRLYPCMINDTSVELFKEINEQIFSYTFNLSVAYNEFRF
tara:strand:- start:2834 stop:4771 length:1938 start_codon:yes stop_codon:yes gene_type:complete